MTNKIAQLNSHLRQACVIRIQDLIGVSTFSYGRIPESVIRKCMEYSGFNAWGQVRGGIAKSVWNMCSITRIVLETLQFR